MGMLKLFLDPTFLMGVSCYVSVLFVVADGKNHTITFRGFDSKLALSHFTDPTVAVSVVLFTLAIFLTWNAQLDKLKNSTIRRAAWYLWNGCVFHLMDGMVGLGFAPILGENYECLDNRLRPVPFEHGGPHPGEENIGHMILMIEIFVMMPLCLVAYFGVVWQKSWAQDVEILLCSLHVFGTIVWLIPPVLDNCRNLAPIGQPGCTPSIYSLYNLFFFYFGSGLNVLWILVGSRYLIQAMYSNYKYKTTGFNTHDLIVGKKTKSL